MSDASRPVWPNRAPIFRLVGMLLSVLLGILFIQTWYLWSATPLERFYFAPYTRLSLFGSFRLPNSKHKEPTFRAVFVANQIATAAAWTVAPGPSRSGRSQLNRVCSPPGCGAIFTRVGRWQRSFIGRFLPSTSVSLGLSLPARSSIENRMQQRETGDSCEARIWLVAGVSTRIREAMACVFEL